MTHEQKRLKEISDIEIGTIVARVALFTEGMERLADALHRKIVNLIAGGDWTPERATAAQSLVDLQRTVQGQLNTLGYEGLVKRFIGGYDETRRFALETLAALNIQPARLARIDEVALQRLREMDYSYLEGLGATAVREVAAGVVRSALVGRGRAEMIDAIKNTLDTRLKNNAVTYADTALVNYDRTQSSRRYIAAGITRFLFRGPRDIKNRPFCEKHVDKVYSLEEINGKLNDELKTYAERPLLPCLVWGGGWGCRHVWAAVGPPAREAAAA